MDSLGMFGLAACAVAAVFVYACVARAEHDDKAQLARLRESAAYRQLCQMLAQLNHLDIDEVRIECSGITVTSVCPAHIVLNFAFKQNGNSLRNDSFTRLYAQLIAEDFPLFTQNQAYKLRAYRVYRVNGKAERAYAFIMRRGYKDFLLAQRFPAQLRIY